MIHLTGCFGYKNFSHYLLMNKSLINVYTIKLTKHKNDKPHGIVKVNVGIIILKLFSFRVQLILIDKLSF